MKFQTIIQKITSRKFWLAAAGVVTGIAMALGVDQSAVGTVAGAVTSIVSVVTYVVTEGKVDAESVKKATESVQTAFNVVANCTDTVELTDLYVAIENRLDALKGKAVSNAKSK